MAAKRDSQICLTATIWASRADAVKACTKAVEVLGKRAVATGNESSVVVSILPGLIPAMSTISPTVGIEIKPGTAEGTVSVDARIVGYRTSQTTFMFIPVSAKRLVGKAVYLNYLDSLHQELRAIDKGKGTVRIVHPA